MARTALTPQKVTSVGLDPQMTPANLDGHSVPLRHGLIVLVANGGAAAITITIPTPMTVDGLAVSERTVSVPAGATRFTLSLGEIGAYRQPNGTASLDFSDITSVDVALLQAA